MEKLKNKAKTIDEELADFGLKIHYSDAEDRERIDLSIEDDNDNVAWLWGATPYDVDWECNHPAVDYEDDEMQGECVLCGSYCDWHYVDDGEGHKHKEPHTWYPRKEAGGIIGEIVDYYKRTL